MLFSDFMLVSFAITYFYFCFLIEVEFLTYLRLCKPLNEIDFIIVIVEKIKPVNLGLYLQPLLLIKMFMIFLCLLLSLTSAYIGNSSLLVVIYYSSTNYIKIFSYKIRTLDY